MEKQAQKIAETISHEWRNGIVINDDDLFFLDSSFGIVSSRDLEQEFDQLDETDRETILEMLLFPGHAFRLLIEPLAGIQGLNLSQTTSISDYLYTSHNPLLITHPSWELPVSVKVFRDHTTTFVKRLYLDRSLDSDICRALDADLTDDMTTNARVQLRSKNVCFGDNKKRWIIRLIQNWQDHHPPFPGLFEMVLDILSNAPDDSDMASAFLNRRDEEKKTLDAIGRFEQMQERYGMEYLLMQRYPVPVDSFDNVFQRLKKMNLLVYDIFKIADFSSPEQPVVQDMGRFDPEKDIQQIFDILS